MQPQATTVRRKQSKAHGAAIRAIRERSEISVRQVCAHIRDEGVATDSGLTLHEDSLRNIELGRQDASDPVIGAIARALRVPKAAIIRIPEDAR